jgi:hypothetical protein
MRLTERKEGGRFVQEAVRSSACETSLMKYMLVIVPELMPFLNRLSLVPSFQS